MSRNHAFLAERAARLAPPDSFALDFGCGDGALVRAMRARGLAALGVDVLAEGWSPFAAPRRAPGLVVAMQPGGALPFADERFAVVTANQVLEHVPEPLPTLAEIRRVLRPGGAFLALFPTREVWLEPHLRAPLVHRLPEGWRAPLMRAVNATRRTDPDWARTQLGFLRERCFYRPAREWLALFGRFFALEARLEGEWLGARGLRLPGPVARALAPRLGGVALLLRRA